MTDIDAKLLLALAFAGWFLALIGLAGALARGMVFFAFFNMAVAALASWSVIRLLEMLF